MRAIVPLFAIALMLFLSGCTTTGDTLLIAQDKNVFNDYNGAIFNDYNQTFGSPTYFGQLPITITDANYITLQGQYVNKLIAGTNTTVSCTGTSGDGNCTINSTAVGSNYTDINVQALLSARMPINWDANVSGKPSIVNKLIAGTAITLSCTGSDSNGNCTINSTATGGGSGGRTYTGIAPIIVNNDANTIDWNGTMDIDGGFANSTYLIAQKIDGGGA